VKDKQKSLNRASSKRDTPTANT